MWDPDDWALVEDHSRLVDRAGREVRVTWNTSRVLEVFAPAEQRASIGSFHVINAFAHIVRLHLTVTLVGPAGTHMAFSKE